MSLKDDYEVTGTELDTLVFAALECDGVLGAKYLNTIEYAADFYIS